MAMRLLDALKETSVEQAVDQLQQSPGRDNLTIEGVDRRYGVAPPVKVPSGETSGRLNILVCAEPRYLRRTTISLCRSLFPLD